jgi:hypothetical protein
MACRRVPIWSGNRIPEGDDEGEQKWIKSSCGEHFFSTR